MERLTIRDPFEGVQIKEEERLLSLKGFITDEEQREIIRCLVEKLADYEDAEEQGEKSTIDSSEK